MVTFVAVLELAGIIWAITAWRLRRRTGHRLPRPPGSPPWSAPEDTDPTGAPVAGWLIGHHIAYGDPGVPGDPLPGGHLGSPANLAYWGGMFGDEGEDENVDGAADGWSEGW